MPVIVKHASRIERQVYARFRHQNCPHVPWSVPLQDDGPGIQPLLLQDLGAEHRPHSLAPITPELARREAAALAAIHHANLGDVDDLVWLPATDSAYFHRMIEQQAFRPAWQSALQRAAFRDRFAAVIDRVEAAASTIVADLAILTESPLPATLVHTDINPSNVLVHNHQPFLIDWDAAHRGTLYLDIPHHCHTLERAMIYRDALASLGVDIPEAEFAARYAVAARYTGLRYIWWTFDAWLEDRENERWVELYLAMILR
jgi:aminoglycoside phosphotransferase (APT) family kinase protein